MGAYWALFRKTMKSNNYNELVKKDCLNMEKSVSLGVKLLSSENEKIQVLMLYKSQLALLFLKITTAKKQNCN